MFRIASVGRNVAKPVQRRFSSLVATPSTPATTPASGTTATGAKIIPPPAPKAETVRKTPVWRSKLSAFFAGVAITSVVGYIRLREDVYAAASEVNTKVLAAHKDMEVLAARNASFESRIAKLERTVALAGLSSTAVVLPDQTSAGSDKPKA